MNLFYRKLLGMELTFLKTRIERLESIAKSENNKQNKPANKKEKTND